MTRRAFLAMVAAAPEPTPRNRVAILANEFHEQYTVWSKAWNAMKPGTVDLVEDATFQPLRKAWRAVEHARDTWIRGK